MKPLLSKKLFTYAFGILLLIIVSGVILSQVVDNYYVLLSVLIIEYIILIVILLQVFDRYIKPIDKATNTVDNLVKGNYRARIHHPMNGEVGELFGKINALARNLSELTIHEQMQAEQFSTVIDNSQSGLVLIDEKGYIHLVNRKFISIFGNDPQDYIGYLYYDVLENETIHQTVQETFLYEKNMKRLFTHYKETDKYFLEIVGAPIFNDRNMLRGAVLVLYDITELKKLEVMRKDFVANVSHELKTPITSIKGFAETLLDETMDDPETRKQFLGIIYEESKRIQVLIEDLLILSKLEKDEFQLVFSNINLSKLLEDIVPLIQHQATENNIDFTTNVLSDAKFVADKERIKQVLINLLANAISYTPAGGEINLTIDETEDFVSIQVTDTGIGIEQEALPRIFERFYRVDKARSRNTGGTGLGLAIVKHIVEVHDGKISVESELNKGTTFSVYLPKDRPAEHKTSSS
ncbi:two-component system histidine kinase PnpS [Virgibacillus sp. W0181]|uniref:two-component system histidine kinase PnpS n=1 Tax=Virgibacillus sp. W0181 TaxID=3391581 RepID=UPI003F465541